MAKSRRPPRNANLDCIAEDLRPLAEAGLIEVHNKAVERDPLAGRTYERRVAPALTGEQQAAFEEIKAAMDAGASRSFLLHGVTGSVKTEVYLAALDHAVAAGKRAIVLVPEIALTPQTVRRFAERFPGEVAVLHSGLFLYIPRIPAYLYGPACGRRFRSADFADDADSASETRAAGRRPACRSARCGRAREPRCHGERLPRPAPTGPPGRRYAPTRASMSLAPGARRGG